MNDMPELLVERLKSSDSLRSAYQRLPMFVENKVKGKKLFFESLELLMISLDQLLECKQRGEFVDKGYTLKNIKLEKANGLKALSFFNRLFTVAEDYDSGRIQARSNRAKYVFNQLLMSGLLLAMVSIGNNGGGE